MRCLFEVTLQVTLICQVALFGPGRHFFDVFCSSLLTAKGVPGPQFGQVSRLYWADEGKWVLYKGREGRDELVVFVLDLFTSHRNSL